MLGDEHTHRCADDAPDKSAYVSSYEATLTEPGIFEGEFEGSDNSTGFTIDYVGSFSFSR